MTNDLDPNYEKWRDEKAYDYYRRRCESLPVSGLTITHGAFAVGAGASRDRYKPLLMTAVAALEEAYAALAIPAAEYVPSIPHTWKILEKAITEIKGSLR